MIARFILCLIVMATTPVVVNAFGLGDLVKGATGGTSNKNMQMISGGAQIVGAAVSTQSEEEEISFGKQVAGNLLGAAPLVPNPELQQYVSKVGMWVAMQSERPSLPWRFGVIDTDSMNAFATPGGYIFITKGLYNLLESEEDLAGVLGHEIAHVVKQHQWEVVKKQKMLAGATTIASSQVSGNNSAILQKLMGTGAEICARGLDKSSEYEADFVGVVLARRAGYESNGLYNVLDKLAAKPGNDTSLLFSTHPAPIDRINGLSDSLSSMTDALDGGKQTNRFIRSN